MYPGAAFLCEVFLVTVSSVKVSSVKFSSVKVSFGDGFFGVGGLPSSEYLMAHSICSSSVMREKSGMGGVGTLSGCDLLSSLP